MQGFFIHAFVRSVAPAALAMAALVMGPPAFATETSFAEFTGAGGSFKVSDPGTLGGNITLSDNSLVSFSFLPTALASTIDGVSARLSFSATAPDSDYSAILAGLGIADQSGLDGTLTFKSTALLTIGATQYAIGANLLTVTFTNAVILGNLGAPDAILSDSSTSGSVIYSSDFMNFENAGTSDFAISLGAITNPLSTGPHSSLSGFIATPTGSYSRNSVPEPATWAMMLVGLGAIGWGVRGSLAAKMRLARCR